MDKPPEITPQITIEITPIEAACAPHTPQSYEHQAVVHLKSVGLRITTPRIAVIRALAETTHVMNPYEIHTAVIGSGRKVDVVSVYRILAMLLSEGLIHRVGLVDGYAPRRFYGLGGIGGRGTALLIDPLTRGVSEIDLGPSILGTLDRQIHLRGLRRGDVQIEASVSAL